MGGPGGEPRPIDIQPHSQQEHSVSRESVIQLARSLYEQTDIGMVLSQAVDESGQRPLLTGVSIMTSILAGENRPTHEYRKLGQALLAFNHATQLIRAPIPTPQTEIAMPPEEVDRRHTEIIRRLKELETRIDAQTQGATHIYRKFPPVREVRGIIDFQTAGIASGQILQEMVHAIPPRILTGIESYTSHVESFVTLMEQTHQSEISSQEIPTTEDIRITGLDEQKGFGKINAHKIRSAINANIPRGFLVGLHDIYFSRRSQEAHHDGQHVLFAAENSIGYGIRFNGHPSQIDRNPSVFFELVYHELGHNAHNLLTNQEIAQWENIFRQQEKTLQQLLKNTPRNDASSPILEDFAQSFALFASQPALLKELSPERFTYMKDLFISRLPSEEEKVQFEQRLARKVSSFQKLRAKAMKSMYRLG